jgi:hypothetical protein
MTSSGFRIGAALLLGLAAPGLAQPPAQSPEAAPTAAPAAEEPAAAPSDQIVVTGTLPLVVNLEQVALRCIACRNALARLQAAAATRRQGDGPRAVEEVGPSTDGRMRPRPVIGVRPAVDTSHAGAGGMIRYTEQETRARITARDGQPSQPAVRLQADRFNENLMRLVGPIVDRLIVERRAPAAYASEDPALRGVAATDVTQVVIAALDRDHSTVDLLARSEGD